VTEGWLDQLIALATAPLDLAGATAERGAPLPLTPTSVAGEMAGGAPDQAGERSERRHHQSGRVIGLVGPMSNYAAPPQLGEPVPYRDLDEMQLFARRWRDQRLGKWFTVPKLSGFCLLMKRAVLDTVGGLDERFGLGFLDDDDLAVRARRA